MKYSSVSSKVSHDRTYDFVAVEFRFIDSIHQTFKKPSTQGIKRKYTDISSLIT